MGDPLPLNSNVKGIKSFIVVMILALGVNAGITAWAEVRDEQRFTSEQIRLEEQRARDCRRTLENRGLSVESDIATWRDVQDILGNDPADVPYFEDLFARIRSRSEALPPPADCED